MTIIERATELQEGGHSVMFVSISEGVVNYIDKDTGERKIETL